MITLDRFKAIFGDEGEKLFTYLGNKQKGGRNNSKGNTFENFYSVYQIARFFNKANHTHTFFSSQICAFVDDLVIELVTEKAAIYCQIKDVTSLSWQAGDHSINDDFLLQKQLATGSVNKISLRLVVSQKDVYEDLVTKIPEALKDTVEIELFETATSLNNLIRKNTAMRDALVSMCAIHNPTTDKLEALGTIVLGTWGASNKNRVSLERILNKCYEQNPHFIKGHLEKISENLQGVFESIKQFSYKIENGFVVWSFNNTDSGILEYQIGSKEYMQWENDVLHAAIKSFEDLEPFLSA